MERRLYRRIEVRVPAGVYFSHQPDECVDVEILNLSLGGAFIHWPEAIQVGEELLLEIRFGIPQLLNARVVLSQEAKPEDQSLTLAEKGSVRWTSSGAKEPGFGIAFIDLKPDKREFLVKILDYFERQHRARWK